MNRKTESTQDEAARLDRDYTGDAVNARTDELQDDLERQAERLQRKIAEPGKPEADAGS